MVMEGRHMGFQDKINILIVDDRPESLFVLENILKELNLNIVKATSGNQALSLMLEYDFALVLLDVKMPEIDGFETAKLMRENEKTRNTPIIFVTAIDKNKRGIFKGYEIGAVDYLFKPIEPLILKSKVSVFVELYRQKEKLKKQTEILKEKVDELMRLRELNSRLEHLSSIDVLTGISNRRSFEENIKAEWKRAIRSKTTISLIMIDIDHFKEYNDYYGHQAGDKCLEKVAKAIVASIQRPADLVARYGGEEFVAVLPESDRDGAVFIAEKIRNKVESLKIRHEHSSVSSYVTVSLGTATMLPQTQDSVEELIYLADRALFRAKYNGRNNVES